MHHGETVVLKNVTDENVKQPKKKREAIWKSAYYIDSWIPNSKFKRYETVKCHPEYIQSKNLPIQQNSIWRFRVKRQKPRKIITGDIQERKF